MLSSRVSAPLASAPGTWPVKAELMQEEEPVMAGVCTCYIHQRAYQGPLPGLWGLALKAQT